MILGGGIPGIFSALYLNKLKPECNIYLIEPGEPKQQASTQDQSIDWIIPKAFANLNPQTHTPLDLNRSLAHLQSLNLTPEQLLSYQIIVNDFFSGEPAGILFYEFQ